MCSTKSSAEVLAIGRAYCERRGWPWTEPVHFSRGWRVARVRTNARTRGGNVNLEIELRTGTVIKAGFARR